MDFAKHYLNEEITDVATATGGIPMPFGSTFMGKGIYTVQGRTFDFTRQGLYRLKLDGVHYFINRIVTDGANTDIYALMSAICWNHIHGSSDEGVDYQTMADKGRYQKWRLRCGVIIEMLRWLLPQLGFTVRSQGVITLGPKNGFDDGHAVLETQHNGEWRMWDLTNGCYFRNAAGKHLSTAEFIAHIANGAPMPTKVKLDGNDRRWDNEVITFNGLPWDMGLYGENFIGTDAQQEAWFRRIYQAIN